MDAMQSSRMEIPAFRKAWDFIPSFATEPPGT
jgi:hypothetical protein